MVYAVAGLAILLIILLCLIIHGRNSALANQVEVAEKRMEATEKALNDFTAAIAEYAYHLSSHTGAIQGLAEASQELKKSAAFQNNVVLNLIKNTEDALVRKEALLSTMKTGEKPVQRDTTPSWERTAISYRALHPPVTPAAEPEEPASEDKRTVFETANLIEAMVLPYYRALYRLERESPASQDEKSIDRAKKAVDAIMLPLYQTLYKAEPPDKSGSSDKGRP